MMLLDVSPSHLTASANTPCSALSELIRRLQSIHRRLSAPKYILSPFRSSFASNINAILNHLFCQTHRLETIDFAAQSRIARRTAATHTATYIATDGDFAPVINDRVSAADKL